MNAYEAILGFTHHNNAIGQVTGITKDETGTYITIKSTELSKLESITKSGRILPTIKRVIFNPPATIVMWSDDTKTVVKADKETYDPEKGLAMAISKKALGNKGNYFEEFKKYATKDAQLEGAGYNIRKGIEDGFARAANNLEELASRMRREAEIAQMRAKLNVSYERLFDVYTKKSATKADLVSAIETVLNEIGEDS